MLKIINQNPGNDKRKQDLAVIKKKSRTHMTTKKDVNGVIF